MKMKYLIIGCGAVGASIGGFLSYNGQKVDCIARGKTLTQIRTEGLILNSEVIGNQVLKNINAFEAENYDSKADIIFVCIKDYSLAETYDVIERSSNVDTIVIPVLNTLNVGKKIAANTKTPIVYDGCVYIIAENEGPGIIKQTTDIFRIVCGPINQRKANNKKLEQLAEDLTAAKIKFKLSDDIKSAKFAKFSLTSALASTCSYFDITSESILIDGKHRNFLLGALSELKNLAIAMNLNVTIDIVSDNMKIIDVFPPKTTTSMQRDIKNNRQSEIDGMVFDIIDLGEKYNVSMPHYNRVGKKFFNLKKVL